MSRRLYGIALFFALTSMIGATSVSEYWTYANAQRAAQKGQYDDAVAMYSKLIAKEPDNLVFLHSLADVLYVQGRYQQAHETYALLEKKSQKSEVPYLWYNRGNIALKRGHYSDAIRWYRRTLAANPSDLQAKHNLELARQLQDQNNRETPPTPEMKTPPPNPMLNALDQLERESRRQRKQNQPPTPREVEQDW